MGCLIIEIPEQYAAPIIDAINSRIGFLSERHSRKSEIAALQSVVAQIHQRVVDDLRAKFMEPA
jgi:hypothetical protein